MCERAVFVTGHWARCSDDAWSHHSHICEQGHACDYEALGPIWVSTWDTLTVAILMVWCYLLSSFAQQGKRPFMCAVCFGAWYPLVTACHCMACILLYWRSKNCTCSLVLLPYTSVSHLRSVLELDVKAMCFLLSLQPAVLVVLNVSYFLVIHWWILKTRLLRIFIFIKLILLHDY